MMIGKSYENVFEALEDDMVLAQNLRMRAELMHALRDYIKRENITQAEAARRLGVTQPRVSDLMRGRIDRFSIDMLINMLTKVGVTVNVAIENTKVA